eukprot:TRINITY_DN7135_c0_g2_i1.p1 TRINITY_DN7135_c0_g2~~TRINITY_DN7135_c0_g2_i1.p1  ORF type:complete len:317 (+),score=52.79 TRINITY_DN7135_c0_g2_i1:132-953(+)
MYDITRDDTLWTAHYRREFEKPSFSSTSTSTSTSTSSSSSSPSLAPISYYSSFSDHAPSSSSSLITTTIRQRYIYRHLLNSKFTTQYHHDTDKYDLIKMFIVGPSGNGKSSFRLRFDQEDIREAHVPTVGAEFSVRSLWYRGNVVKMQLWDLAGQVRFKSITQAYYRGCHFCLLFFDINDPTSFDLLDEHFPDSEWQFAHGIETSPIKPIILIGNKKDAITDNGQISKDEAVAYCRKRQLLGYIEMSCKLNYHCEEALEIAVDQVMKARDALQ